MSTPTRMQLAIGLILAFTCAAAPGLEPNQPAIQLQFRTNHGLKVVELAKRPPIMPSYAAILTAQWRFEQTNEPNATDLLKTSAGKSLSDSIKRANRIAAISVQSSGTQTSFPEAKDLPTELTK